MVSDINSVSKVKLLSKISYYYFWLSAFVLTITGTLLFLFLRYEISNEIAEQLELQSEMITSELHASRAVQFPLVQIQKGDEAIMNMPKVFKDTVIFDFVQHKMEDYYYLEESVLINKEFYRIRVMTTFIGWDNYSKAIGYIFISIVIMLIVLGTMLNYFISRKIWKPFIINLRKIKLYSVSSKQQLDLLNSDIIEFQEMNLVLSDLAARSRKEYTALKEFTENASHEIQTPLSILRTRLESISQFPVDQKLAFLLGDAKQAVTRLTKVNKGLLLLAKLENKTFTDEQWIILDQVLIHNLDLMDDLFQHKSIKISHDIEQVRVFASSSLMEILVSNLLSNVLNHSAPNSAVDISLDKQEFKIINEGEKMNFDTSKLFSRFGKGSPGYQGNGLGLSIVKQICLNNNWDITYDYKNNTHIFKITFNLITSQS